MHYVVFGPGVKFYPDEGAVPRDPSHVELDQDPVPVCGRLGVLEPVAR